MPERVQLKRTKGWRMPANTVKVDRSTRWGNPYKVNDTGYAGSPTTIEECITLHRAFMLDRIKRNPQYLAELRGKNLACWCKPGELCHADVLLELANAPAQDKGQRVAVSPRLETIPERIQRKPAPAKYYAPQIPYEFIGQAAFDALDGARREAIREREEWANLKKAGAGKFAKEEERMWLRRYRGACLVIGRCYGDGELGDCAPPERITGVDNDHCGRLAWPEDLRDGIEWAVDRALATLFTQERGEP